MAINFEATRPAFERWVVSEYTGLDFAHGWEELEDGEKHFWYWSPKVDELWQAWCAAIQHSEQPIKKVQRVPQRIEEIGEQQRGGQ